MPTVQALELAKQKELDLVQVTDKTFPPVCRLVDFGKLKYEQEKEERKQKAKQKQIEIKGIRLGVNIGEHDLNVRTGQAEKFLKEGDKVQVELLLRGREKAHPEIAREVINKFLNKLPNITIEQPIKQQGGKFSCLICRKN